MKSDQVKKGVERAPHRSLFNALGMTEEELDRPLIGVVNSYNEIVPGHMNLDKIAEAVKKGIYLAGGTPVEIPAIAVCDGIAMNHTGMKYSLVTRELICDSTECLANAHQFDGLVMIPNCDKNVPGLLMAAARINIPTIFVSGGPMLAGRRLDGKQTCLSSLFEAVGQIEKEHEDIKNNKIYEHSFEWRFEFPELLNNEGNFMGFDIIIGNPPYGAKLSNIEKTLFKEYYSDVHMRTPETYCYFISLAFKLVNSNGTVSYIVPNNMFFQNENEKTRSLLLFNHQLIRAINLGDNTFENADVPTCIFIARSKGIENYEVEYSDYRKYNISDIEWDMDYESISTALIKTIPAYVLGLSNVNIRIINEIKQNGILIDSIAEEMASGISTGGDNIFKINQNIRDNYHIENQILFPVIVGSNIDRYVITNTNEYIVYTNRDTNIEDFPNTKKYLLQFIDKLKNRSESKRGILPWFSLNRNRYQKLFEEPKIIMRQTSDSIRCVYDDSSFYVLDSILVLKKNTDQYCYKYIAAVLNSTLTDYLYKNLTQEEGRTFAQVKPINVRKLYIPKAAADEQKLLSILYDYLVFLKKPQQPESFISLNSMFIDLFEKIIDGCIYELFFREHMKEREIDIINHLYQKIIPIDGLSDEDKNNTIISVHSSIFMTDNPVRMRLKLFVSRSQEILKPIIQH